MSSNEEDGESNSLHESKKRRIQRACDICRRKKIRCQGDGVQMPGNRCSNCTAYGLVCTYVETAKKRGPSKGYFHTFVSDDTALLISKERYVEALENKVEKLGKLIRQLCRDESVYKFMMNTLEKEDSVFETDLINSSLMDPGPSQRPEENKSPTLLDTLTGAIRGNFPEQPSQELELNEEDRDLRSSLTESVKKMSIELPEYRFFGKSSEATLIKKVIDAKIDYTGDDKWNFSHMLQRFRSEFWNQQTWEKTKDDDVSLGSFVYPPPELANELIDNYFRHFNLYLPLLHRPTFERSIGANLHHSDVGFASVYLLVCGIGARFSDDPRVFDTEESVQTPGWKWFEQVMDIQKLRLSPPTLYNVQSYALMAQYLGASSSGNACWTLVGIGLRLSQDIGAHRRTQRNYLPAEDELWKRAFWVLLILDCMCSAAFGRPCAIHEEDFDVDLPIDCNDEFWDHEDPAKCFQQPEGTPSKLTAFILFIKLFRILSVTLRTVYAIDKSKVLLGYAGPHWEQTVIAELDSALNSWVDLVPFHLRWDPNREDTELFDQSVALYAHYYLVQILIHRPFIPTPNKPSPLSFPSLAICMNAARSCCHLVDVQRRRSLLSSNMVLTAITTSGIMLLLNLWSGKRSGLSADIEKKDMRDVNMCIEILGVLERKWKTAGRLRDILCGLASAGDLDLEPSPPTKPKRSRDPDAPASAGGTKTYGQEATFGDPRNIAGLRRVHRDQNPQQHYSPQTSPPTSSVSSPADAISSSSEHSFEQSPIFPSPYHIPQYEQLQLPMYSNDLGRLPLHGPFNFVAPHAQFAAQPPMTSSTSSAEPRYQTVPTSGVPSASYTGSSLHQQPTSSGSYTGSSLHSQSFGDMSSLRTGFSSSTPVMNTPGLFQLGTSQAPGPTGVQATYAEGNLVSAPNSGAMFNAPMTFRTNVRSIVSHEVPQSVQHHQTLGNPHQRLMYANVPGIDLRPMDPDLASMWLNAPAGLLMEEWGAYVAHSDEHRYNQPGPQ